MTLKPVYWSPASGELEGLTLSRYLNAAPKYLRDAVENELAATMDDYGFKALTVKEREKVRSKYHAALVRAGSTMRSWDHALRLESHVDAVKARLLRESETAVTPG